MPRQKNIKPTTIYWLVDVRPEIIAAGWTNGPPFYCGKTGRSLKKRLAEHAHSARIHPNRKISDRLKACGEAIHAVELETVPATGNWSERERHWISILRDISPDAANASDGGEGYSGYIMPERTKELLRIKRVGKPLSAEHRAKLSAAKKGKPGRPVFEAERLKRSESQRGRNVSPETREKLRKINLGKKQSPETIEKRTSKLRGMRYHTREAAHV